MHAAHTKHGYTLKEIADHLEIHYSTASKAIKEMG
jgi:DNA-binding MarR family transcriptional regulator